MEDEKPSQDLAKIDKQPPIQITGITNTGPNWRDIARFTTWPNPVLPQALSATGDSSEAGAPRYTTGASISDCPCEWCRRYRGQNITPDKMYEQLESVTIREYAQDTYIQSQGLRIRKLEELVKMLTKAIGVNEEFLSEAYKGTV